MRDLGHTIESMLVFLRTQNYNHEEVRSAIEALCPPLRGHLIVLKSCETCGGRIEARLRSTPPSQEEISKMAESLGICCVRYPVVEIEKDGNKVELEYPQAW